ncbi:MAG: hypothetical protein AAF226_07055 [Verrucomicrobiota bacterium]
MKPRGIGDWLLFGPSLLCLDAPLVAYFWALIFGGGYLPMLIGLFGTVWFIYLFDRLWDIRKTVIADTMRHQFAKKHPKFLLALFVPALTCIGYGALSISTEQTLRASVVAAGVAAYFVGFKFLKPSYPRFPFKEVMIGLCFAGAYPVIRWPLMIEEWLGLLVFAVLCTVNCLIISQAESASDEVVDPGAFFAKERAPFPFFAILIATSISSALLALSSLPLALPLSLLTTTLSLWFILNRAPQPARFTQPLADTCMWLVPAIAWLITHAHLL